ncbi:hypothetical protein [Granulicella paludicola]|uniref:hypothetical protein n=1 Tax=Granulicella paludicola TaxID=474951 RepID=UPI0021E0DA95|nr:hypothetical protein [Granulicella paludicola]
MRARLLLPLLLLIAPMSALADQLVPAGSIVGCTVAEGKISSQTMAIGDPVMCTLSHTEKYGRASFPYGSYLTGRFVEFKDPGHFVGKGYMEIHFDRLIVQPDTIVPINARVIATTGYKVDMNGRILGKGHATADTVEWLIPVLWPIDLINLPRRGPRPVLKPETQLTLKIIDDFGIPTPMENAVRTPALVSRITQDEPTYQSYRAPIERQEPPVQQAYASQYQPQQQYQPQYAPQPQYQQQSYNQPPQVVVNVNQQPQYRPRPVIVPPPPMYYPAPVYVPYGYYRRGPYGPY